MRRFIVSVVGATALVLALVMPALAFPDTAGSCKAWATALDPSSNDPNFGYFVSMFASDGDGHGVLEQVQFDHQRCG